MKNIIKQTRILIMTVFGVKNLQSITWLRIILTITTKMIIMKIAPIPKTRKKDT
jgi:hypothetical protein